MRIGHVIGKVTLNHQDPAFKGGRWLIVNPLDAGQMNDACHTRPALTAQFSPVVYDNLGAGEGDIVGFVEGAEATAPFDREIPIDAICVAIFETIHHNPPDQTATF
jgi:carbon dioxide concentrating mechanism protein CcmL